MIVADSGARSRGFETYHRRFVSLSKTLYSQKVLVEFRKLWLRPNMTVKNVDWDVKAQHTHKKKHLIASLLPNRKIVTVGYITLHYWNSNLPVPVTDIAAYKLCHGMLC